MGHSFFVPIARALAEHPARCGFPEHWQTDVFHGGASGSPGELWNSAEQDVAKARELIETGTVDLIGLANYFNTGSELSDYKRWIDMALAHNQRTRFLVHAPWCLYEGRTFREYEAHTEDIHFCVHTLIDQLQEAFPDTRFACIPQGRWMVCLWRLFEQGSLPGITGLCNINEEQSSDTCLFNDELGHGGSLAVSLGALLWLRIIYNIDLNEYEGQPAIHSTFRQLAQSIVDDDSYCSFERK